MFQPATLSRHCSAPVLTVEKVGDGFAVVVSPPHARETWRSTEPLSATEFWKGSAVGCHSTDITDALYEADPSWTIAHHAEVLRRRRGE